MSSINAPFATLTILALIPITSQATVIQMSSVGPGEACPIGSVLDGGVRACCGTCDRGHGVVLPCTGTGPGNDTVCTSCVDGSTFSSTISHEETCQPCSHCPPNAHAVHRCNVTHNTKCECVDGFWYEPEKRVCAKCFACQPGFEVSRSCGPYQNTHCRPCSKGYYSSSYGFSTKCRLCSLCKPGQVVRTACSVIRDTDCVDANALLNGIRGTEEPMAPTLNLFPVYCAIPAFILVSLVLFVIVKRWRHFACNRRPPCKTQTALNHRAPISMCNTGSACRKPCRHSGCADASVGNGQKETKPMLLSMESHVRCLPDELVDQLERNLCGGDEERRGWIALAKGLGYTDTRIRRITKEASSKRVSPCKQLFQDWSEGDHATVGLLMEALEKMDRGDLALLIRGELNSPRQFNNNNQTVISGPVHFV